MLKAENKSKTKLKHFTFHLRISFFMNLKNKGHKILQVLIFIKQSAIENNIEQ